MPYIGHNPTNAGSFVEIDSLDALFNGSSTAFTLNVGGVAVTPTIENLLVILDGVVQQPTGAFTLSGSTLTFTEAPASGTDGYIILMGQSASVGGGTITADELAVNGDGTAGQLLKSDGDGTFTWLNQNAITGITSVGTIGTGVWNGTAIASAYLDADTAHLSGTQTFSGAKTFSSDIAISTSSDPALTLTSAEAGTDDWKIYIAGTGLKFRNTTDSVTAFELTEDNDATFAGDIQLSKHSKTAKLYISGDGTPYTSSAYYTTLEAEGDRGIDIRSQSIQRFYVDNADTLALTLDASKNATFAGSITAEHSIAPEIMLNDTGGTSNRRIFRISGGGDVIHFEGRNNDNSGAGGVGGDGSIAMMSLAYGGLSVKGAFRNTPDNNPNQYQLSFGGDDTSNPRWGFRVGDSSVAGNDEDLFLDANLTSGSRYNALRIDKTNGWVGIGLTETLAHKLQVESNANTYVQKIRSEHGSTPYGLVISYGSADPNTTNYPFIAGSATGTDRFKIYSDGSYSDISDEREKENIKDTESQLANINKLEIKDYNRIGDESKGDHIGVIAQQIEPIYPHLVRTSDDEQKTKMVYKIGLISPLIKAVQELSAKVEALENA